VAENLNVRIAKGREITFGLVVLAPQRGMERTEDDIKRAQGAGLHIACAQGIEIHFDGMQNGQALTACAQLAINSFNLSGLFLQLCFINSIRDRQAFGMIGDGNVFVSRARCPPPPSREYRRSHRSNLCAFANRLEGASPTTTL